MSSTEMTNVFSQTIKKRKALYGSKKNKIKCSFSLNDNYVLVHLVNFKSVQKNTFSL